MVDSRFPICGGVRRITLGKNLGACLARVVDRRVGIVAGRCDGNCGGWSGIGFSVYDLLVCWLIGYGGMPVEVVVCW